MIFNFNKNKAKKTSKKNLKEEEQMNAKMKAKVSAMAKNYKIKETDVIDILESIKALDLAEQETLIARQCSKKVIQNLAKAKKEGIAEYKVAMMSALIELNVKELKGFKMGRAMQSLKEGTEGMAKVVVKYGAKILNFIWEALKFISNNITTLVKGLGVFSVKAIYIVGKNTWGTAVDIKDCFKDEVIKPMADIYDVELADELIGD